MDWLTALWADIWRHIYEFELAPPRTLDQLMAWLGFLGVLIAVFKFVWRRLVFPLVSISPIFPVVVRIVWARYQLQRLREILEQREREGLFEPRLVGLYFFVGFLGLISFMIFLFVLMGIVVLVGTDAIWVAIGIGSLLVVAAEGASSDHRALLQLLAGERGRYARLIRRAKFYTEDPTISKFEPFKEAIASIRAELPVVLKQLENVRASLGLPPRDIV